MKGKKAGEEKVEGGGTTQQPTSYSVPLGVIAIAMLIIIAIAAFFALYSPAGQEDLITLSDQNITNYEGTYKILNANSIAIVMDSRGITQENRVKVFECGIGFVEGLSAMGKSVHAFALQDDYCIGPDMNKTSIGECNKQIHTNDYIILVKGTKSTPIAQYYSDHFLVEVPQNNTKGCTIKAS